MTQARAAAAAATAVAGGAADGSAADPPGGPVAGLAGGSFADLAGAPAAGSVAAPAAEAGQGTRSRGWGPQGQATTTILLRHGQTALSVERRFAGRGDAPLTETGLQQAAAAAARLQARGGIDLVVSSPLSRARRTAEAVAGATRAGLLVDEDLAETDFGDWEGLTFGEVMKRWPEEMAAWMASADIAPPGGESLSAAARRTLTSLDRLLADHVHTTMVLVSHVTPIKTIICRALLAPPAALFRIHLDVASLSEADWFSDGPALLRSMNDTAHLRAETTPRRRKGMPRAH